jgi:hypothetical protein
MHVAAGFTPAFKYPRKNSLFVVERGHKPAVPNAIIQTTLQKYFIVPFVLLIHSGYTFVEEYDVYGNYGHNQRTDCHSS